MIYFEQIFNLKTGSKEIFIIVVFFNFFLIFSFLIHKSLICLHHRGTSEDNKIAAFRECYGRLHELRSLAPNAKMIAVTATATKLSKETTYGETIWSPRRPKKQAKCYLHGAVHAKRYWAWVLFWVAGWRVEIERHIMRKNGYLLPGYQAMQYFIRND